MRTLRRQQPPDRTALLVLDVISDYRFPNGMKLLRAMQPAARSIAALKRRAKAAGLPCIYVNDNLGRWQADRQDLLRTCLGPRSRGRELVQTLVPEIDDYFMFKPRHSAFFCTALEPLLQNLGVGRLIVTGATSHQCVLFTCMDAYVRDFGITVPRDCIAAPTAIQTQHALFILEDALAARTPLSTSLEFARRNRL